MLTYGIDPIQVATELHHASCKKILKQQGQRSAVIVTVFSLPKEDLLSLKFFRSSDSPI